MYIPLIRTVNRERNTQRTMRALRSEKGNRKWLKAEDRAFALPFVHISFIPVGRTKERQECAPIFPQVGSSAVHFKKVLLTTESKISLRSHSCSPTKYNLPIKKVGYDRNLLAEDLTKQYHGAFVKKWLVC